MASRKRKPLSLKEKLNILAVVDANPKKKRMDIANDLGLPASTVNTIVSKRKEIEGNALVFDAGTKQARGARHGELEEALLKWFKQARASGVNFDGSILRQKAMEIADVLGIDDFTASNGWISRFRARHAIAYRQVNGEAASVNPADIENWISLLPGILNAHDPRDVYKADELGLFFKVQPNKTLCLKGDDFHGGKCALKGIAKEGTPEEAVKALKGIGLILLNTLGLGDVLKKVSGAGMWCGSCKRVCKDPLHLNQGDTGLLAKLDGRSFSAGPTSEAGASRTSWNAQGGHFRVRSH
ncbi:hypothetical protein V5799_007648 [Amblyomma americanum]|uniref:HTH CENPB-type domain-containing protein n=1 Tax=Amblyomma americanum TaxID=6943 RepID=A0AAQ4FFC5_AMBAM